MSNARRREGDTQSSDRQQGAEQAEEQLRGRQRGRGREQQAEASSSGSATLTMTRPGRSVFAALLSAAVIAVQASKHGMLIEWEKERNCCAKVYLALTLYALVVSGRCVEFLSWACRDAKHAGCVTVRQ